MHVRWKLLVLLHLDSWAHIFLIFCVVSRKSTYTVLSWTGCLFSFLNWLHSLYFSHIKLCGGYSWSLGPLLGNSGVGLYKKVSEFLIRRLKQRLSEHWLFPEIRGEITVGLGNGIKSGLGKVAQDGSDGRMKMQRRSIPAIISSFLGTGTEMTPVSLGTGMRHTNTEPQWLVTLQGTAWGLRILFPQQPQWTGTTESLARINAQQMAVATSWEHLTPIHHSYFNIISTWTDGQTTVFRLEYLADILLKINQVSIDDNHKLQWNGGNFKAKIKILEYLSSTAFQYLAFFLMRLNVRLANTTFANV